MHFGQALETDMEAATQQGKRKKAMSDSERTRRRMTVLHQYLGIEQKRQFRDPAAQRKV